MFCSTQELLSCMDVILSVEESEEQDGEAG